MICNIEPIDMKHTEPRRGGSMVLLHRANDPNDANSHYAFDISVVLIVLIPDVTLSQVGDSLFYSFTNSISKILLLVIHFSSNM